MLPVFLDSRSPYGLALNPFSLSFLGLVVLFHVFRQSFPDTKRLAWFMSTISSLTMSIVSLPFLWDYLSNGGSLKHIRALPEFALLATRFFQAYLVCDLVIGSIYYRSHISLLTGWIHHPLYVLVVEVTIRRSWPHIFCLCAVMEIPTFVLGVSTLFPRIRNNILFAVCFFVTRILFHIILSISFVLEENRNSVTGGSYVPAILLICILPLHVSWFVGCIKGFIRRARQKTTPISPSQFVAPGPSPTPSSIRPSSVSSALPVPLRRLRLGLRLSHRRLQGAIQSFQYDFLESPTSKQMLVSNIVSAYMPRRETLYEWVGLGQRRRRFLTSGMAPRFIPTITDSIPTTSDPASTASMISVSA